uniref:Uncharacterized protein n=1 Tax=Anopheles stephensi TaxID=30069 RepID=A0A182YN93_ANOST
MINRVAMQCICEAEEFVPEVEPKYATFSHFGQGGNLFRTKRRSSIAPLPALRLNDKEMMSNDFDTHSVLSNQASISSASSLLSLLKEKMQNVPGIIRKKKRETKDYKLRVFVGMLFLIIVFLVSYW